MNTPATGFGISAYLAHIYSPAPKADAVKLVVA